MPSRFSQCTSEPTVVSGLDVAGRKPVSPVELAATCDRRDNGRPSRSCRSDRGLHSEGAPW
jgi:hypothetical protein